MILTDNEIGKITFGKASFARDNDGLRFNRFTENQMNIFSERNHYFPEDFFEGYFLRNCATDAGIAIDFYTDSPYVTFHIAEVAPANGSQSNSFDIIVNGKVSVSTDKAGDYTIPLKKRSRVTLCFPYFAHLCLGCIELGDGSEITAPEYICRWLALGDSITHGCTATRPSYCYPTRAALKYNVELMNQANAGYVHDSRIVDSGMDFKPDIVTSAYGINDNGRKNEADNRRDTVEYCEALKKTFPDSKIYLISPIWAAFMYDEGNLDRRNAMYAMFDEIAHATGIELIDGRTLVPHDRKYFLDDAVHPCDAGFAYYASRLGKIFRQFEK